MTNKKDDFKWMSFLYGEYGKDNMDDRPRDQYAFLKFLLFFIFLLGFTFVYGQMLPHEIKDPQIRSNFYDLELRRSFRRVDYGTVQMDSGSVRIKLHVDYRDTAFYQAKATGYFDSTQALMIYKVEKISGDSIAIWPYVTDGDSLSDSDTSTVFWETFAFDRGD